MLVFRDQKLTKAQQVAFTEQFGTLERHTKRNRGDDDMPLVHIVSNLGADGKPSGTVNSTRWHSDKSFRPEPSMATILHAVTLPPDGGDTCFVNMYAAYEALAEDEKAALDGVRVIHSWELSRENIGRVMSEEEIRDAPPMSHPLARVHPETGRKLLYVNSGFTSHIKGMAPWESRALLSALTNFIATTPKLTCRVEWQPNTLTFWDNRCTQHHSVWDYYPHTRYGERVSIIGEERPAA